MSHASPTVPRVLRVDDEAGHRGSGTRDRHRDGQVAEQPGGDGRARCPGQAASDDVEVGPPEPEPDGQPQQAGSDRIASWSACDSPSTTPRMTSPRTMIVNRPKRSTIEWVGAAATRNSAIRPKPMNATTRPGSRQPTRPAARRPGGTRWRARPRRTAPCPGRRRRSGLRYCASSCPRTEYQSQPITPRRSRTRPRTRHRRLPSRPR